VQSGTIPERFRPLVEATNELAERFRAAGHSLYLVGGSVRDALLPDDLAVPGDKRTSISPRTPCPSRSKSLVSGWADAVWTTGKRFGTIGSRRGGREYEITTHRAEVYGPHSRKPSVTFGTDIAVDLSRRDFTVNAMALSLPDLSLIDPTAGWPTWPRPGCGRPSTRTSPSTTTPADAARRSLHCPLRPHP